MKAFDLERDRIAVMGLGYVGLPLSLLLARQYRVTGFDTDGEKVRKILRGATPISEPGTEELLANGDIKKKLKVTSDTAELKYARIKIITVGTPYDPVTDYIDYSQLNAALDLLNGRMNDGDIVILKSTVPPGTTNNIVRKRIVDLGFSVPDQVGIAFSPERMVEGQAIRDFTSLPKIIGASDPSTSEIVSEIIGSLGGEIIQVTSTETAEMVKMVDNYSRFVFLGLTNEIALISEKVGVDVLELLHAAKQGYPRNAGLMIPGPGVGGSCLNKDPFILKAHLKKLDLDLQMVNAATSVNRSIPVHIADLVLNFAGRRRKVTMAGVAFKGDTDDTRFTPTFEIKSTLERHGFSVVLTDPYVSGTKYEICKDLYDASANSNILLLLTDHSVYRNINLAALRSRMSDTPLILDTRGLVSRESAIKLGFEYHGYGRL